MAPTVASSANHSKFNKNASKSAITTTMAGPRLFRISKNSAVAKKTEAVATHFESIFGPSKKTGTENEAAKFNAQFESMFGPSKTGTEDIQDATKNDDTNGNQLAGATGTTGTTVSKKPLTTQKRLRTIFKVIEKANEESRLKQNLSRHNLREDNLRIRPRPTSTRPSRGTEKALGLIAGFNVTKLAKSTSQARSLFLQLLHPDVMFQIYDQLAESELEVVINATKKYHSPLSALKATCIQTRDEIDLWATKRRDITLTPNPTFGLINLAMTTFRFSWSRISRSRPLQEDYLREIEKYQRCYSPTAAKEYLPHLELWQQAAILAKTCNAAAINHEICENEKLENVGPSVDHDRRQPHGIRCLMLNNHDNSNGRPEKFDIEAKDYMVFNPEQLASDEAVPDCYKMFYSSVPYVWSKDWENHNNTQEYCFVHPTYRPDQWVRGIEACGTETIRNKWNWSKTFDPVYNPPVEVDDSDETDDNSTSTEVNMRGGELMGLDEDDIDPMDLTSESDETDFDMDREEDDDIDVEITDEIDDTDETQDLDLMDAHDDSNRLTEKQVIAMIIRIFRRRIDRSISMKDAD